MIRTKQEKGKKKGNGISKWNLTRNRREQNKKEHDGIEVLIIQFTVLLAK